MSVARQSTLGATRVCPHCKATVLQSANICPGCQHHLRFNTVNAEPAVKAQSAMRIEGTIHHPARGEQCEYCVVIAITNEKGEKSRARSWVWARFNPASGTTTASRSSWFPCAHFRRSRREISSSVRSYF